MGKEVLAFIIGVVLVTVTAIVCVTYYNLKKDDHLKSNVESAIVKGIDPLAVRCAYGHSDTLCIVYATTHGKELPQALKK
jgi:hypothetical protein